MLLKSFGKKKQDISRIIVCLPGSQRVKDFSKLTTGYFVMQKSEYLSL
jgi:hypothetical protein